MSDVTCDCPQLHGERVECECPITCAVCWPWANWLLTHLAPVGDTND